MCQHFTLAHYIMSRNERADNDIEWLLENAKQQLDEYSVDRVITEFAPVLSEFEAYVEGIAVPDAYRSRLSAFTAFLKSAFHLSTAVMLVHTNKYSTDMWGPLYWSFLHYASILLQYALCTGLTDDVKEFPVLVYNIDMVLPCNVCIAHYLSVKHQTHVRNLIKIMSFGHVMQGLYQFHNVISENVYRHRYPMAAKDANVPPFRVFTAIDFAKRYHCYPLTTVADNEHKSSEYCRPRLDWQSPLHISVSVILGVDYKVSYSRASNYVKRMYGQLLQRRTGSTKPTPDELMLAYPRPTVYTVGDQQFEHATSAHDIYDVLQYCIANRRSTKSNEDKDALEYVRQAVDTIRTAYRVSGRKLNLATHNAALDNDMFSLKSV